MFTDNTTEILNVPEQLVKDFLAFIAYIESKQVELTKTKQWLSRNNIIELNALMSAPEEGRTKGSDQDTYPLLHLYYHLSLSAGFFSKIQIKNGKSALRSTGWVRPHKIGS